MHVLRIACSFVWVGDALWYRIPLKNPHLWTKEYIMNKRSNKVLSLFLALVLAVGSLSLVGCGGNKANEQDNCYGEDMPVINQ